MVNITALADGRFKLRVALPTDKVIPNSGDVQSSEVPTDKFLQADVVGGAGAVRAAFGSMNNYVSDFGRTIVAIPFASLITDRRLERDSAKWVTRIYWPISYPPLVWRIKPDDFDAIVVPCQDISLLTCNHNFLYAPGLSFD